MPYETFNKSDHLVVDLRSDTISQPTDLMREAMKNAEVGDDVYEEDPTVKLLEKKSADMLGKESALFVPSGTMANLIAIMVHCNQRDSEAIVGDLSHTFLYEQAGPAQIAGVQLATLKNNLDGTFCLDQLRSKIRKNPDVHEPHTKLVIVENTHNMCGGKILPLEWLKQLSPIAKEHNFKLHMDGARLFNAAVESKVPAKVIVKDFDSVCFCLSKSLGAPIGSVLVGSKTFIDMARRMRKVLGGGMRQAGVIAAAGIIALENMIERLRDDHSRIRKIGKAIVNCKSKYFYVDSESLHTNIMMIYLKTDLFTSKDVILRLAQVKEDDEIKISVKVISRDPKVFRITTYHNITDEDVDLAIKKIILVIKEFDQKTGKVIEKNHETANSHGVQAIKKQKVR